MHLFAQLYFYLELLTLLLSDVKNSDSCFILLHPFEQYSYKSQWLFLGFLSKKYLRQMSIIGTVKPGNKERFDKEKIGIKEPFPVTNLPFTS